MTYCVAMSLDAGMIFASDSRTNAGVDQIARFSKMRVFARDGDRVIVMLSSGNLSITQNAINIARAAGARRRRRSSTSGTRRRCSTSRGCSATRCARCKRRDGPYLAQNNIDASRELHRRRPDPRRGAAAVRRLQRRQFHRGDARHAAISRSARSKYGKPMIDRVVTRDTALLDATKCTIVSFDSTMRSQHLGRAADRPARLRNRQPQGRHAAAADRGIRPVFPDGPLISGARACAACSRSCPIPTGL